MRVTAAFFLDLGAESWHSPDRPSPVTFLLETPDARLLFWLDTFGAPGQTPPSHWVAQVSPLPARPEGFGTRTSRVDTVAELLRFLYRSGQDLGKLEHARQVRDRTEPQT